MGSTTSPWAGGPGLYKKAAEQAMESEPVSCFSVASASVPVPPSLMVQAEISPFLPELLLLTVFILTRVKQTRDPKPQARRNF